MSEHSTSVNSIAIMFSKWDREKREAEIRLYGVLWYLVECEIISQGKAMELAHKPLYKIIDECMEWRKNS